MSNSRDRLYFGGEWCVPDGQGTIDVINPATEETLGCVPQGTTADVDAAVKAARAAFETWANTPLKNASRRSERFSLVWKSVSTRSPP